MHKAIIQPMLGTMEQKTAKPSFIQKLKAQKAALQDFYMSGHSSSVWVLVSLSGAACIGLYLLFMQVSKRWF